MTLGGYDASQFIDSNTTFQFNLVEGPQEPLTLKVNFFDLIVAIRTITIAGSSTYLLRDPILSFVDSAEPYIWLPLATCQAFQEAFNLTYDPNLDLYLVNETVHSALLAQNATISFTLSNDLGLQSNPSLVTIDMPYGAFDLQLTSEYPGNARNATYYFPIRSSDNSEYLLGRVFFQHAYLIADYERFEFSIHQARFPANGTPQDLRAILPSGANTTNSTSAGLVMGTSLSVGAFVGVVVSIAVVVIAILSVGYIIRRRRRRSRETRMRVAKPKEPLPELQSTDAGFLGELRARSVPPPELANTSKQELAGDEAAVEIGGRSVEIPRHDVGNDSNAE